MQKVSSKRWILTILLAILAILAVLAYWWVNRPKSDPAQSALATADQVTKLGNYEQALADYTRVIQSGKDLARAYEGRGNVYTLTRHFDEALQDYTTSLSYERSAQVLTERCNVYRVLSDNKRAMEDCTAAVQLDPNNVDTHISLAALYLQEKDLSSARSEVDKAMKIDPKSDKAYYMLSQIETQAGELDKAIAALTQCITLDPTNPTYYWDRGFIYLGTGKPDLARTDMEAVLKYGNPEKDGNLLLQAGSTLHAMGVNP
ncbi:MAG: tetratricopeptide repeat protein [Chloroflexi bacterium]|nr:tetratricopeptide repeat protein [Chloroflexota bacterium]